MLELCAESDERANSADIVNVILNVKAVALDNSVECRHRVLAVDLLDIKMSVVKLAQTLAVKALGLVRAKYQSLDLAYRQSSLESVDREHLQYLLFIVFLSLDGCDDAVLGIVIDHSFGELTLCVSLRAVLELLGNEIDYLVDVKVDIRDLRASQLRVVKCVEHYTVQLFVVHINSLSARNWFSNTIIHHI